VRIVPASLSIGVVRLFYPRPVICLVKIGILFRKYAEIAGGLVLIAIGIRILVDHLAGV
jgi:putative Mn2+ efflux pump MntP